MELLQYSPPDILVDVLVRARPALRGGQVAMAYGYTLLAPYFELDPASPAHGQTGFLPHPRARRPRRSRPWAGTCWAFRAT
jgi:multiple sugar transport system substrate-binding protein